MWVGLYSGGAPYTTKRHYYPSHRQYHILKLFLCQWVSFSRKEASGFYLWWYELDCSEFLETSEVRGLGISLFSIRSFILSSCLQ